MFILHHYSSCLWHDLAGAIEHSNIMPEALHGLRALETPPITICTGARGAGGISF